MSTPSHVRAISLMLALSVVVGGWLTFEYSNRPTVPATPPAVSLDQVRQAGPHKHTENTQQSPVLPAAKPSREERLTYKCQKDQRTTFSDRPCSPRDKLLSVTTAEKKPATPPDDRLTRMKQVVAQMESERLTRDQVFTAEFAARASAPNLSKSVQCKEADDWIAQIDTLARQPHEAQEADRLTAQRKWWMDRRFDLRC